MKKLFVIIAFATLLLTSCKKDDGVVLTKAVVTVCGEGSAKPTLNLDDNTVLVPENLDRNPYSKECRAFTVYQDKGKTDPIGTAKEYRIVKLYGIDSILTKNLAPNLGEVENVLVYGNDPIDLYRSWMTVCEDGYVTLHFLAKWGYPGTIHSINLVKDTDKEDAFHLELRHNYNGDNVEAMYRFRDGIVAFNIKELLEKEKKSTYDITLSYKGHYGVKEVVFHYTPGASAILGNEDEGTLTNGEYFK